ncbi:Aspartic peptidase [Parasponia andersonii]|uniref:Aspartic peptidase n=1 Tax=Parasponia andersonii TaxID=3476 RepID=A0A2P5AJU5_PARAD|nr:Aspartic peptidase [Parasponia andersonii]
MEPDSDRSPQLKGVVIISLPPPDNPSLGKTITAFTLCDSPPYQTHQENLNNNHHNHSQTPLPIQTPQNPHLQISLPSFKLFTGVPRKLFLLLGISVFALVLYTHVYPMVLEEFRRSNDDDRPKSFIFPLYPKLGIRGKNDVEIKLGRFVDFEKGDVVTPFGGGIRAQKVNKLVSSAAEVDSSTIFPVRGNVYPDGLYYTYMLVGNPPRPYFLDMDTGSDLTWIQCDAPCSSCAKGANSLYKPNRGNIVPPKDSLCTEIQRNQKTGHCETCEQCDYEIRYADSSSSLGVLAKDELRLTMKNGSLTNVDVVFGCAYDQQGLLLNTLVKTDGILGLSKAKVSLPSQLASKGIIKNVVGHCFSIDIGGGGYMFLGDDFVPHWGMSWMPMLDTPSMDYYHSQIVRVNYGNMQLNLGAWSSRVGQVVFDSGSSYTYFTKEAYTDLVTSLEEVYAAGLVQDSSDPTLPICWKAKMPFRSVADVKQFFKTITLQFGSKWWIVSTRLRIPPEGYLIINSKGNVCLGILDGSKVHDGSTTILGDISLRGHLVVYDNENQKIGWMNSYCAKPRRFDSPPFFE